MNILTRPQFISFLPGALRMERLEEGVRPWRLTEAQAGYYARLSESALIRSRCPAGIALHLRTTSPWLELSWRSAGGSRKYLGIDLEVNGVIVDRIRIEDGSGDFRHRWTLPVTGALQEVRLQLPHFREIILTGVEVEDGSLLEAIPRPTRRLLCLGDSITQGMDAAGPTETMAVQLARLLEAELLNQGMGGHVFDAASLAPLPDYRPDWITVAYGTNDWGCGMTPEDFSASFRAFLDRLTGLFEAPVYLITPLWRSNWQEVKSLGTLKNFTACLAHLSEGYPQVHIVPGFSLVPNHPSWFVDGLHPNEQGFLHYAVNLYRLMRKQYAAGDISTSLRSPPEEQLNQSGEPVP